MKVYGKGLVASSSISRCIMPAPGLKGGASAATNVLAFKSADDADWRSATDKYGFVAPGLFSNAPLSEDDEILVVTANGAGYGDPFERNPAAVLDDVLGELMSPEQAEEVFGVIISDGAVDASATSNLRATRQAQSGAAVQ